MGKKRIGTMAAVVLSMMMVFSNTAFASESESPRKTLLWRKSASMYQSSMDL